MRPRQPRSSDRPFAVAVFGATFLLRWLTLDFENDYFMHVSWGAEMLRGQWPVRDFVEPGFPLQTTLSWLGLRLGGYQLFWEGIIACTMIAAGASFTFLAARLVGVPRGFALIAAAVAVTAYPRLYAYPKAVAYPAAIWALAAYVGAPNTRRLVVAGAITAAAFLLRHDHGVYAGFATMLGIVLYHGTDWRASARGVLAYGVTALLLVAPWLAWVQLSEQADQYWSFLSGQSRGLATGQRAPDAPIRIDHSRPYVALAPVDQPRVGIRWAEKTTLEQRREREARYGLVPIEDGSVYRLSNIDASNVRALLLDPLVEDTSGIDRGSARVPPGLFSWTYVQLQRYVPLVRLRILPGVVNGSNAQSWLAWTTFLLPGIALVLVAIALVRGVPEAHAVVIAMAVLSAITYQTLVRASPDSRLGDIAAATGVLLAWCSYRAWTIRGVTRFISRAIVLAGVALTLASALSYGRIVPRLADAGVDGPTNIVRRARDVGRRYLERPIEVFAPAGARGLPGLSRWLNTCTQPHQRIAVLGFEPQIPFFAERGFAGGMLFYDLGWVSSETDQALTIARWSRQDVPVVLAMDSEFDSFSRDYPRIRAFIDTRYTRTERSTFGGNKSVTVFTAASAIPTRVDPALGLPCFR